MPIIKAASSQARQEVTCPRCGADIGERCKTPKGRKAITTHTERMQAYREKVGEAEYTRRHSIRIMRVASL